METTMYGIIGYFFRAYQRDMAKLSTAHGGKDQQQPVESVRTVEAE